MKLLYTMLIVGLVGCAPEYRYIEGPQGPAGEDGQDGAPVVESSLEGYYVLPDGGYIDIYQDAQGLHTIRSARIVVTNADNSVGVIPISTLSNLALVNGRIYYNANATYTPATHNVKQDVGNTLLTGSLLTELILYKSDGLLNVRVMINNSNSLLFDHIVIEE